MNDTCPNCGGAKYRPSMASKGMVCCVKCEHYRTLRKPGKNLPEPVDRRPDPPLPEEILLSAKHDALVMRVEALEDMVTKLTDAVEEMVGAAHGLSERLSPTN
ncbi:hypothetical protein LCGC14_1435620 [marine sediment metagenome]|uniref:Uncharacterized protein n=1 Tax=marine sediment metagenome TaxID=412755 RepID=A0A0F9MP48_9ZZZZ